MSSRVIKFRAWAVASQKMFYPDINDGWEIFNGTINPLPNTHLMQFTGLQDKNGKDIYEGDILKCFSYDNEIPKDFFSIWTVEYNNHLTSFCVGVAHNLTISIQREIEVIGNIYENENLIK